MNIPLGCDIGATDAEVKPRERSAMIGHLEAKPPAAVERAFDVASWATQLLKLNPWAGGLVIGEDVPINFRTERRNATLARYGQARDAWNVWANDMLALKKILEDAGRWATKHEAFQLVGDNAETRYWLFLATSEFSWRGDKHAFDGPANFQNFIFPGNANFKEATFFRVADFEGATFIGSAYFSEAAFSELARFNKASFADDAYFQATKFSGVTLFDGATFLGEAQFYEAVFSAAAHDEHDKRVITSATSFSHVTFSGDAFFADTTFALTLFDKTTFLATASFFGAIFSQDAMFAGGTFSKDAVFTRATFEGKATFADATFGGSALFGSATFCGAAIFLGATFSGGVGFNGSTFADILVLANVQFNHSFSISGAKCCGRVTFYSSVFRQDAQFSGVDSQTAFSLENATFNKVPNFVGSAFKGSLRLDHVHTPRCRLLGWTPDRNAPARFRELKRLAAAAQDHDRELDFLAQELRTSRFHAKHLPGFVPRVWEWKFWFGLFYGVLSDFGWSLSRPALFWTILFFGFAIFYLGEHDGVRQNRKSNEAWGTIGAYFVSTMDAFIAPPSCVPDTNELKEEFADTNPTRQALYLSLKGGVVGLYPGGVDVNRRTYGCLYGLVGRGEGKPRVPDAVFLASVAQTIASAILIFLFSLGVRNLLRVK